MEAGKEGVTLNNIKKKEYTFVRERERDYEVNY